MYSSRQAKILLLCMEQDDYIMYESISDKLQTSKRTITRELSNINNKLKEYNLSLQVKKGQGLKICGTSDNKARFRSTLQGTIATFYDKRERQRHLCIELLKTKEVQKIAHYARIFDVSPATISNDLEDIFPFLQQNHIQLSRQPGRGIQITGREESIRLTLSLLYNQSGINDCLVSLERGDSKAIIEDLFASLDSNMIKLLDQEILQNIVQVLWEKRETLDLSYMAKYSYIGLVIHLMIAIQRLQQGKQIEDSSVITTMQYNAESYQKAKQIAASLSERFALPFSKGELFFITIHLDSAKKAYVSESQDSMYLPLIEKMVSIFQQQGFFIQNDADLYSGISAHLQSAMLRLQYGLPIYNPMLSSIKKQYPFIFMITTLACKEITSMYGYAVNTDEIGYLALHFGAAIERYKNKNIRRQQRMVKVGVVCSSGIGASVLLLEKLRQVLDSNVQLQTLATSQMADTDCEVLVSTFVMEQPDVITISPLLTDRDIHTIQQAIQCKRRDEKPKSMQTYSHAIDLVTMMSGMQEIMDSIKIYGYDSQITKDELLQCACKQIIGSDFAQLFNALLKREALGSNVYHGFGFALFHCASTCVTSCQISIIRPNKGVFVDASLQHIKVALLMVMPKNSSKEKQQMMSYISAAILENDTFYQSLQRGSIDRIKMNCNDILHQYLLQYLQEAKVWTP